MIPRRNVDPAGELERGNAAVLVARFRKTLEQYGWPRENHAKVLHIAAIAFSVKKRTEDQDEQLYARLGALFTRSNPMD